MKDYRSKVPWPDAPENLVTYDGERPGSGDVRIELDKLGGKKGVRRSQWTDPFGRTYELRTRAGMPEVVQISGTESVESTVDTSARGFVAHVPSAVHGALFSPYTLGVLDAKYLVHGHTYTVLPFASAYNVPSGDSTKWNDTVSFHGGIVKINGIPFSALSSSGIPAKSLPWIIPRFTESGGVTQYGDAVVNSYEKRVFAISRHYVYSWASSGVSAVLNNPSARPYKALMCGARIEPATHKAWISQLAFTGEAWDSLLGGWSFTAAQVSMLMAPPYLSKIDVALSAERSLCIPTNPSGVVGGTEELPHALPACQVGLIATHGTVFQDLNLDYVRFYYDKAWVETPDGYEEANYSRAIYSGVVSESVDCGLVTATVTSTNNYYNGSQTSHIGAHEQYHYVPLATNSKSSYLVDLTNELPGPDGPAGTGFWGLQSNGFNDPTYGYSSAANTADWDSRKSSGEFSIVTSRGDVLVGGSFSRYIAAGEEAKFTLNNWAAPYLASYGAISNIDYFGPVYQLSPYVSAGPPTDDRPAARGRMHAASAAWASVTCYSSNGAALGYGNFGDRGLKQYNVTLGTRDPVDDRLLNWTTRDFILYDITNLCFISIDAVFAGAQAHSGTGNASLTINLTIDTPSGVATQTLFTTLLTYVELLPEVPLEYSYGYVPSPIQRVIFAPLYQEQGDFKGASYTTKAETDGGAIPVRLFNFVLKLDTYYAVGTDTSTLDTINFIPCNLLEMLYAYVYSSKYGIDDYERYPVDDMAVFNSFQSTLFSGLWRVNYRNGILEDWLDSLGGPYIDATKTELYRT